MKSAKVINKILLISLAVGSLTVVAGLLFTDGKTEKALVGIGATTAVAGAASTLLTNDNQDSDSELEEKQQDSEQTPELEKQEHELSESTTTDFPESVAEVDLDSFPTEASLEQNDTSNLEDSDRDLEIKEELEEELEQIVSPIQEDAFDLHPQEDPFEQMPVKSESSEELASLIDSNEEEIVVAENTEEFNPFVSSSSSIESEPNEESADLETVDKLIGAFDPTELDASIETMSDEESDELLIEEDEEKENEYNHEFDLENNSEILTELESPTENLVYEAISVADVDKSTEDLAMNSHFQNELDDPTMSTGEIEESIQELSIDSESEWDKTVVETDNSLEELNADSASDDLNFSDEFEPTRLESLDEFTSDRSEPINSDSDDESDAFNFESMPVAEEDNSFQLDGDSASDDELNFSDEFEPTRLESLDEFNSDRSEQINSNSDHESNEFNFEPTPVAEEDNSFQLDGDSASDDESNFSDEFEPTRLESLDEFNSDRSEQINSDSDEPQELEEFSFETMPVVEGDSSFQLDLDSASDDEFMDRFIDEESSSNEPQVNVISESNEFDFGSELADELIFDDSAEVISQPNESSLEELDFEETLEVQSSTENFSEELNFDDMSISAPQTDDFRKELALGDQMALNELTFELNSEESAISADEAISASSDADEFMMAFESDLAAESDSHEPVENIDAQNKSFEELVFDETSVNNSNFNDLMGAFADEDTSSPDESDPDFDSMELGWEQDELAELNSLDVVDKKLDELTEISDDSLGELNDLLGSIKDNSDSEQKYDEVRQDQ